MRPDSKWVVVEPARSLREPSAPVTWPLASRARKAADQLVAYVDASYEDRADDFKIRPGIGMAAPQIGINERIIYIHLDEDGKEERYLLGNPRVVAESVQKCYLEQGEGCLSVADEHDGLLVPRSFRIEVEAIDLFTGKPTVIAASSLLSVCLQHEIDHLDGKLFYDRGVRKPAPDWFIIRR